MTASGQQMEPASIFRPFHASECSVGHISPPPVLELDTSCIASGTFWLDVDAVDPVLFVNQAIEIGISGLAQRIEDRAFIRDGFVSVVAQMVQEVARAAEGRGG